jgi:hypothetical protein
MERETPAYHPTRGHSPKNNGDVSDFWRNMTAKRYHWGIVAVALAFVFSGCDEAVSSEIGYLFRFKVDNNTNLNGNSPNTIIGLVFINGDRQNDDEVGRMNSTTVVPAGERSREYRYSGFTVGYTRDTSKHIFGVKITFADGTTAFDWSSAGHEAKILVSVDYDYWGNIRIGFSSGNW